MFHFSEAITDTKGNALIGYFVKAVNKSTGEVVPIYLDSSSTPIESSSGIENAAEVNADGNAQFYVADGEYHLDIYATDGATFVRRIEDLPMAKIGMLQAATRTELAALDTAFPAVLMEDGFEGIFIFRSSDLSIEVAADPDQNTYIAPTSDETGASGAWIRSGTQTITDTVDTGVVSGLGIAYRELLTFDMAAGTYNLDGVQHTAAAQSITLDVADGTNPRIDVLYLDTEGVLQKLTGTPAASPSKPTVDPISELELTFVTVAAGATTLSAVVTEDIYLEATEWTVTQSGSYFTTASTNNPYAGTKCIETTGSFSSSNYLNFARPSGNEAFGGDGNLIVRIRSKGTWGNKRSLNLQFYCDGATVGNSKAIRTGDGSFDSTNVSSYQVVILPKAAFGIASSIEIDALRISFGGSGNGVPQFYLDNIQLQTNGSEVGSSDLTQSIADARYVNTTGDTMTGDLVVPDEAYDASAWDGSLEVPTKNAIRDKIESLAPGGVISGALLVANNLSDVNSASTSRTNLGLGTGDSPQFTAVNVGNASDTTLARSSAGNLSVEGNLIYRAGGTDVPVTDGGTGASDAATARTNLGITSANVKLTESIIIACSDESTAITTGTAKVTFRMPYAFTLSEVRASVNTAPTGSTILIDINESGSTILSTKLMIDASEKTSTTAATAAVISDSSLADDAEMTIDFDQVGSTIAGKGVKVILIGTRT